MAVNTVDRRIHSGRRCKVCEHPDVNRIDTLLADRTVSKRGLAVQYDIPAMSFVRHAQNHLTAKVKAAVERKAAKDGDVFIERHERLMRESFQYIEDAKDAVKMQKVTAEVETEDGVKLVERYERFRDVGAMAPAITTAIQLQRLLGDATGRFVGSQQAGIGAGINISMSVVLPRPGELPVAQVIETKAITSSDSEE